VFIFTFIRTDRSRKTRKIKREKKTIMKETHNKMKFELSVNKIILAFKFFRLFCYALTNNLKKF
jgi:hypothetical protein